MSDESEKLLDTDFDRFDLFWSEYMAWSMRLVFYSASQYFFFSIRETLLSILPPWGVSTVLLAYSIISLWFIELLFAGHYNPAYEHLQLSPSQRSYRVGRERLLYSGFIYCCVNMLLGFFLSITFAPPSRYVQYSVFESLGIGLVMIVVSMFGVFFGIVFMTGRFGKDEKRVPLLFPFGLLGFLVPTLCILNAIRHFFFQSYGSWP